MDRVRRPAETATPTPLRRPGFAHREQGQAKALQRVAAYCGFTTQLPDIDRVCRTLRSTARRGPAGRAAIDALEAMLRLMPRPSWAEVPILRITNAALGERLGCCRRQAQRHLATLHRQGIVAIDWGRAHSRLRYDVHAGQDTMKVGIDLRPAIVFAHEQRKLEHDIQVAQGAYNAARTMALDAVWAARLALGRSQSAHHAAHDAQIERLRQEIRSLSRRAYAAKAMIATIGCCTEALDELVREAREIRVAVIHASGDSSEDNLEKTSSASDQRTYQKTKSNFVESVVPTIQDHGPTGTSGKEGGAEDHEDGLASVIYRGWCEAYHGTAPLASGDLTELELHSRHRARALGVAQRVINQAIERHGRMPVIGATLFVTALPASARIRSRGGLLASLLRREPGQLTPDRFARPARSREILSESEALAIARRYAPGHQPAWVCTRWHATQQRRGEPIHDPRACLAAFARKLQREQGHDAHERHGRSKTTDSTAVAAPVPQPAA